MLKEVGIQILVKAILKLHLAFLPGYLVGELDLGICLEFLPHIRRQCDVHNLLAIVANLELLVRVYVILAIGLVPFTNLTPDGQSIDIHLIPILIHYGIRESLDILLRQLDHAEYCPRHIHLEIHVVSTELQLDTLQRLAERLMVMGDARLATTAERQREIRICLLSIVIGTHCVHP